MEAELCSNTSYQDLLNDEQIQKKLERLARHKTRIERTFHRSLKELKALQTNTVIEATMPPRVRRKIPQLGNATEISKRTQHFEQRGELELLKALLEAPPPVFSPEIPQPTGLSAS